MFSETYRPRRIAEVVGQPAAVKEFLAWFNTWPEQGRACLLYGKPGTGKTSLVEAAAREMHLDLVALNTSDKRDAETIERVVGNASTSYTLSGARKLILLDEVDGMSGREDSGGTRAIAQIIKDTSTPIVLVANDAYEVPEGLRRACRLIQFHGIHESTIVKKLTDVAGKENLRVEEGLIKSIAQNAGGDLRAALNDLESESEGMRDARPTMFGALSELFRMRSVEVRKQFWNLDEQPENVMLWVAENLPYVYDKRDMAHAYGHLSRADVFLGRVTRRQYYLLWGYASELMTAGVSVAREGKFNFHRFSFPSFIYAMGRTKKKRELEKRVTSKIGENCHCSSYAARSYLPMLRALDREPEKLASLSLYFEFDEEEVGMISQHPEKVLEIMKPSRKGVQRKEEEGEEEPEEEGARPTKKKREKKVLGEAASKEKPAKKKAGSPIKAIKETKENAKEERKAPRTREEPKEKKTNRAAKKQKTLFEYK